MTTTTAQTLPTFDFEICSEGSQGLLLATMSGESDPRLELPFTTKDGQTLAEAADEARKAFASQILGVALDDCEQSDFSRL